MSLVIIGKGGHSKVVASAVGGDAFVRYCVSEEYETRPELWRSRSIIAIGDNYARKRISEFVRNPKMVVHNSAHMDNRNSHFSRGTFVGAGSVIEPAVLIGMHCIINTNSTICHDSHVGSFSHVAPGAVMLGNSSIGECTLLGANSVVREGVKIGDNCIIGMGSVVTKDIPDNSTAFGNPCRLVNTK
jgi:sugar O-acyltransferase (sialic acid O-acetyltransferase NeuD family)